MQQATPTVLFLNPQRPVALPSTSANLMRHFIISWDMEEHKTEDTYISMKWRVTDLVAYLCAQRQDGPIMVAQLGQALPLDCILGDLPGDHLTIRCKEVPSMQQQLRGAAARRDLMTHDITSNGCG